MAAEIDFDELDRAVNSVLGVTTPGGDATATSVPAPAPTPSVTPVAPVALATDVPPQPVDTGGVNVTVNVKKPEPIVPAAPQVAPAPRPNSGRFMDMVHSSSEMKSPLRSSSPSNVGAATTQPSLPDTDSTARTSDDVATGASAPSPSSPASPQDSPFIAAANKVEKRPLGAFSESMVPSGGISEHGPMVLSPVSADVRPEPLAPRPEPQVASTPVTTDPDEPDQPAADVTVEGTPLPEELQSAVLSLESDGSSLHDHPVEPVDPKPVTPVKTEEKPVEAEKPASPHEEILAKLPGSIAQQYREKAVAAAPASGAIFDTQDYHKPLAAKKAAKKKMAPALAYTLWGLALVVVGGGAGYAIYFYVLPMIQG